MMKRYIKYIRRKWANISFSRNIDIQLREPIVSFTFDDAPISAFVNGGRILKKYSVSGTFYISLSLMGGEDPSTRFTEQHLKDSIAAHNEIGCHTYGHTELYKVPFLDGKADIEKNQEEIKKIIPNLTLHNFSYPFGSQTQPIKRFIGERFKSARGIEEGINNEHADVLNLKTVKLYEKRHPLDYIFQKIREVKQNNGWLIFYTHDVQDDPTEWGCTPAYFEAVVQKCAEEKIKVLTVNNALNQIENGET
ncbi:MAG: polysaccharide deacetylase family protein [Saprospiraceae bacterium]|nr:polysaccharide deacetylase family protein [Saprospiraceae bacterium]